MKTVAFYLLASLALSACTTAMNTGITSNNSNQTVTEFPVETAMNNIYTKTCSEDLSTVMYGLKMAKEFTVMPKGTTVFNNQQVQSAEVVRLSKVEGQIIDKSVGVNYFTLNPLVFHGFTKDSGEYSIATQSVTIPKVATVGDSNQFVTERIYSDSSKNIPVNFYNLTWSLSRASANTAWLCIDIDIYENSSECYQINGSGNILQSKKRLQYWAENSFEIINYMI